MREVCEDFNLINSVNDAWSQIFALFILGNTISF